MRSLQYLHVRLILESASDVIRSVKQIYALILFDLAELAL